MTAPKYTQVAAIVRAQVADGTLRPGQPAPSGAQLARLTGFCPVTCRRALRALIAEGTLTRGVAVRRPCSPPPPRRPPATRPARCPARWPPCAAPPG